MAFFSGQYEQVIDEKRRLAIPAKLRERIDPGVDGSEFFFILGPDKHLWLYPNKYYENLLAQVRRSPFPNRTDQDLTMFFANAFSVRPDAQGRMVLPESATRLAVIAQELTLIGNMDHIELWPRAEWNEQLEKKMATYGEVILDVGDKYCNEVISRSDRQ